MQSQSTRETLSISIRATERSSRHNGPLEKEERRVRCYDVWNDDRAILELPADRPTDRPTDATEGALIRFFPPILVRSAAADCARPSLYLARVQKKRQWAMGASLALCGDVNTFHSNSSLSHRRIQKGEGGREASDFTGKLSAVRGRKAGRQRREGGRDLGRRVEWDRHTFLAMFAAMTIYLSADRASSERWRRRRRRPVIGHFTNCGLWSEGGEGGRPSGQISNPARRNERTLPSPPLSLHLLSSGNNSGNSRAKTIITTAV